MKTTEKPQSDRGARSQPTPRPSSARAPRWISWLLPAATLLLVAALCNYSHAAHDLWWQLKTGELICSRHGVPNRDVFSHTAAGRPWHVQEWLSELLFFLIYRRVSPDALVAFKLVLFTLIFALVLWRCWLRGRSWAVAAAVSALAAYAVRPFFDIRPQVFTYLLFSLSLLCLDQWRSGTWRRVVWLLPLITLLWVNLHAAFLIMFALVGVELIAEVGPATSATRGFGRVRTLLMVAALCGLCGLVSPGGAEAYRYAFLLLGHHEMLNTVKEWASPNFHDGVQTPVAHLLLLIALAGAAARWSSARDLLLMVGLLHGALFSSRHVPLLAMAVAPIVAGPLAEGLRGVQRWMAWRHWPSDRWALAGGVGLGLLLTTRVVVHAQQSHQPSSPNPAASASGSSSWFARSTALDLFPVRACDFLLSHPGGGRLFNAYGWGGYCIWRLWPRYRVFIDGRAEVYFGTSYSDYRPIGDAEPGWEERLRHWDVDTVLVDAGCLLVQMLQSRREWRRVYDDEQAVVFRRVDTPAGSRNGS